MFITKKSVLTPKDLAKHRLARSSLMKVSLHERDVIERENIKPNLLPGVFKRSKKIYERQVKDDCLYNPFDLPDHERVFSHRQQDSRTAKSMPIIMTEPRTICDVDSSFYKVIEGRPLRQFTDVKVYMRNIRNITLCRANAAYLKEQIIQIDSTFAYEVDKYSKIDRFYIKTKINFVQFAKESYSKAKKIQEKAEEKAIELDNMMDQLEAYCFIHVNLRNELSCLDAMFETLSKYGNFLNLLAPLSWRLKYDNEYISDKNLFRKIFSDVTSTSSKSLEILKSNMDIRKEFRPQLYFTKPEGLLFIFDDLRRQCLNYIQIDVFAINILASILNYRDCLKLNILKEINEVEEFVNIKKDHVTWLEEKEIEYKNKFEKLLLNVFHDLFASYDNSKLFTCVQYVHTRIFEDPEDPKDSIVALMQQLETLYIDLTSGLDDLNQTVVKEATNEYFSEDLEIMKRAYKAQRAIKECEILNKSIYTSFEPPRFKRK